MDDIYILVNCEDQFHWVLAVVDLKDRVICVFDSSAGTRHTNTSSEIKKIDNDATKLSN